MEKPHSKMLSSSLWIGAIIIVAIFSYYTGKNSNNVVGVQSAQTVTTPTEQPVQVETSPVPTVDLQTSCAKSGPSQKKDYLVPYTIQAGDTVSSIAEKELGDKSRNTEILALNENLQNMTIDSIVYLPPSFIKQSSGHIAEISGKIVKKDNSIWQLTYGGGETGPGVVIPGYWFKDIPSTDAIHIGDCVTILLDNGVKVYSVKKN